MGGSNAHTTLPPIARRSVCEVQIQANIDRWKQLAGPADTPDAHAEESSTATTSKVIQVNHPPAPGQ